MAGDYGKRTGGSVRNLGRRSRGLIATFILISVRRTDLLYVLATYVSRIYLYPLILHEILTIARLSDLECRDG